MRSKAEYIDAYDDLVERAEQLCALAGVIADATANPEGDETAIQPAQKLLAALLKENHRAMKDLRGILDQISY